MKFGLFFLGEYTHMITTSFMLVTLFFGGWQLPWLAEAASWAPLKLIVFLGKMWAVIVVYMLVRWTILRFRFDQLMALAWKGLIPLALLNLVVLMVVVHLAEGRGWSNWLQMGVLFLSSAVLLIGVGALGLLGQTEPMGMQRVGRTAPRETPARIA
jgi:NADH-quinone oxidoreductase subunit H